MLTNSVGVLSVNIIVPLGYVYVGAVINDKSRDTGEIERMIVIGLY
jgi:hypothetical protein